MSEAEYFRSQAATCNRIARTCFDLAAAGQLRRLATELETHAEALEHADAEQHEHAADQRGHDKPRQSH